MKKINLEYLNPFGAGILCGSMPNELIERFENLSNEVLDKKITEWNNYLVGRIHDEWKIPDLLYKDYKVDTFIDLAFYKYAESYYSNFRSIINLVLRLPQKEFEKKGYDIQITRGDGWVNSMKEGEYNPTHQHTNCDLSSIFYLDDYQGDKPRDFKRSDTNKDGVSDLGGVTEFIMGSYMNGLIHRKTAKGMSGSTGFPQLSHFNVAPKKGDFMIFPSWLMHSVYPFIGKGERVSISVNAGYKLLIGDDKILKFAMSQEK